MAYADLYFGASRTGKTTEKKKKKKKISNERLAGLC